LDGYNPAFAPSAEQLCIVAKGQLAQAQRERVELEETLAGQIEQERQQPTKEDLEAKLGRPLPKSREDRGHTREDRGYMRRVLADIEARKARKEEPGAGGEQ
jgi:hypothetical protein